MDISRDEAFYGVCRYGMPGLAPHIERLPALIIGRKPSVHELEISLRVESACYKTSCVAAEAVKGQVTAGPSDVTIGN